MPPWRGAGCGERVLDFKDFLRIRSYDEFAGWVVVALRVLIVEDEERMARFLQLELEHEGYAVEVVPDGRRAWEKITGEEWDLVLLDLMLPDLDGMELCRRVRARSAVPIIMLTARDSVGSRIAGLDMGADDYLTKPFAIEELLARMRSVLRRARGGESTVREQPSRLQVADLVLDAETREVWRAGRPIKLTKTEFELLRYLMRNAGIVLSRESILNRIWGYNYFGSGGIVDVYISYLRSKVDDPFPQKLIHTVRGVGYVLKEVR